MEISGLPEDEVAQAVGDEVSPVDFELLQDMGVEIVDREEGAAAEEEVLEEEEEAAVEEEEAVDVADDRGRVAIDAIDSEGRFINSLKFDGVLHVSQVVDYFTK